MCTLIVLDRVVPGLRLVVASNRDEYLSRPAAPPARLTGNTSGGGPEFVAPQDLEAGGSWMGFNSRGLFVGLTNRPMGERREGRRSRGLLVVDALAGDSAEGLARQFGRGLDAAYNPFNLFYSDGRASFVSSLQDDRLETVELAPGPHILCNRDLDDPTVPKISGIQRALASIDFESPFERLFEGLVALLRSHRADGNPLDAVCVHTTGYGTRSSSIWALGGRRDRMWYADAAPCEAKYRNYSRLLDGLRQTSQGARNEH